MCGIVGYVGSKQATPILMEGLSKLEYRGYDSAGIAVYNGSDVEVIKAEGRLSNLLSITEDGVLPHGTVGIGHTRWSTHGRPSDINSHPQTSGNGMFAVVHNGIIENYMELKTHLQSQGVQFVSETDTEVIAHLFSHFYNGNLLQTARHVSEHMEGSYALGVICSDFPDTLIAIRKDSPLIIGLGEGENYIASDVTAILAHTRNIHYVEEKEIALITCNSVHIYDSYLNEVKRDVFTVDWNVESAEKGGYEHFMFKEIMEQPRALLGAISPRIKDGRILLDIPLTPQVTEDINQIYIMACGSAYHVGVIAKYLYEDLLRIPTTVALASEFRYQNPIVDSHTLAIVISQSGETADSLAALRKAKSRGAKILSIVNVVGSSITKESDYTLYTWAGPEIAVATTKAYSTQLGCVYLLGVYLADALGKISPKAYNDYITALLELPEKIESILQNRSLTQLLAAQYFNSKHIFFIGRNIDYAISLEGSLKLKEISYTHSEAYAAGELKHGTISLIEEGSPVIALMTSKRLFDKTLSNVKEVKARGAIVIAVVTAGSRDITDQVDHVIELPSILPEFAASLAVVPLQLFSYYVASLRGCDIDKPRNLAKSVTVE